MTTVSWPVRDQPITHALWRDEFAGQDGITDDLTGQAFKLTMPGSGDVATIAAGGKYRLRGFTLHVSAEHQITLPAVATGGTAKVYVVGVRYDPSAEAAAAGPLSIYALESGTYSTAGPVIYSRLYEVVRLPGVALSGSTVRDQRGWAGAAYYGGRFSTDVGSWPVGSRVVTPKGDYIRGIGTDGPEWVSLSVPFWRTLQLSGGLTTFELTPSYALLNGEVIVRGELQRTNGADLAPGNVAVTLGTLPVGFRPGGTYKVPVASSFGGSATNGRVRIDNLGQIQFTPPEDGCTWTSLDGIRFFAEG